MSENHRLQTEENKTNSTDMSSDAAEGSSKPRISDVFSSAYRATKQLESSTQPLINAAEHTVKPEQECVRRAEVQRDASRRGQRQNKSISAAHPAIYLNTHSHKLLRRAIRIWKMPVPMLNGTGSSKPKPRNFQEQLKQVEMLRTRSGDSGARTRSVRDLQLGSGTDSCPSSSSSSEKSTSRRFREQLRWYRMLSRRGKRHRPREFQSPPAGSCWVKGSCECPDDGRDDPDDPVIRAPERRTSRRLWRRRLDSSSSETSPINPRPDTHTRSPINPRPDTHTRSPINPRPDTHTRTHTRVSFCLPDESKVLDINSNLSKEASAFEQKNVKNQDLKLAVQSREKLIPQSSMRIPAADSSLPEASPQLKISKHQSDSPQIPMPSHTASHTHTPASSQCCVKWKSVLLQRFSVSFESQ